MNILCSKSRLIAFLVAVQMIIKIATAAAQASVVTNDNRTPAGQLKDGVLRLELYAAEGIWYPEESNGPGRLAFTFGETGRGLENPGPLIRVPAGTDIRLTLTNQLPDSLLVHGLHARPGPAAPIRMGPGAREEITIQANAPGTYFYWGTTGGASTTSGRFGKETQLNGAFVVDGPGKVAPDRLFLIGMETDSAATVPERPLRAAVVNGLSWPHSSVDSAAVGDTVTMRWINLSDRPHPMHLHGFYFRVDGRGDIAVDTTYNEEQQRLAVTELILGGRTATMTWSPDRPGNWMMHCHMTNHMAPELRGAAVTSSNHQHNHGLDVMSGLIIGWQVKGDPFGAPDAPDAPDAPAEPGVGSIRLVAATVPELYGASDGQAFSIAGAPGDSKPTVPGPPIVLTRGEQIRITFINRLREPSSVHWHGIELDGYYDGVSGWSGVDGRVSPAVAPSDSFIVRFTPRRSGTFMYHSHLDEARQLASGMYGPIVVLEPGERYDSDIDRIWMFGQNGPDAKNSVLLNGSMTPTVEMHVGRTYRIRVLNIHTNQLLTLSVLDGTTPLRWRLLAKDGASLPSHQALESAATTRLGVGEVYDFEFRPERAGEFRIQVAGNAGGQLSGRLLVTGAKP